MTESLAEKREKNGLSERQRERKIEDQIQEQYKTKQRETKLVLRKQSFDCDFENQFGRTNRLAILIRSMFFFVC